MPSEAEFWSGFSLAEYYRTHPAPGDEFMAAVNMAFPPHAHVQPSGGIYWYVALCDCKFQMQRPDGSISEIYTLDEGDLFHTMYQVRRQNLYPLCPMATHELALTRSLDIRTKRAFRILHQAIGGVT